MKYIIAIVLTIFGTLTPAHAQNASDAQYLMCWQFNNLGRAGHDMAMQWAFRPDDGAAPLSPALWNAIKQTALTKAIVYQIETICRDRPSHPFAEAVNDAYDAVIPVEKQ